MRVKGFKSTSKVSPWAGSLGGGDETNVTNKKKWAIEVLATTSGPSTSTILEFRDLYSPQTRKSLETWEAEQALGGRGDA